MLSHERRLYLHLFRDAVFFFHHSLVALLSLKEIVVEGFPYPFGLRTFPAKHPLSKHLAPTSPMCHDNPFIGTD
jgi:hypothetical protein